MRGYLDAAYALAVEERVLAHQGISRPSLIDEFEAQLMEVLPDEVSEEELERAAMRRQAEENRAANERLAAMMGMRRDARDG